jgi:hypothetical protein
MRTFEDLRGPADTWCTSLAYWLGVYRGEATSEAVLAVAEGLGAQYDFEEQADRHGRVLPEDAAWPKVFAPVAPIQLARGWSPVPRAVELLGEPRHEALDGGPGIRTIAVAWAAPDDAEASVRRLRGLRPVTLHERRLLELLAAVVIRAADRHAHVLLVARPGWSDEQARPMSRRTASLMAKAGFVTTTRTS